MKTMSQVAAEYDRRRDEILAGIKAGKTSASMSGIEYYPKPWGDLNAHDAYDLDVICTSLSWDGSEHLTTHVRLYSEKELKLRREITALSYKPYNERSERMAEIEAELEILSKEPRP